MNVRIMVLISILSITVGAASCPTKETGSEYPFWIADAEHDTLEAHDPKDDVSLSKTCNKDSTNAAKCIVYTTDVYRAMTKELRDNRAALSECQKGSAPK